MRRKRNRGGLASRLITPLLLIATLGLVAATLASYLAGNISPASIWQFAFAGLAYPFLLFANLFVAVIWLMLKARYALIPLVTLLIGWGTLSGHLQMKHPHEFDKTERHLRIASYNAHYFNIWAPFGIPQKDTLVLTEQFFSREAPDILCLQESVISHPKTGNIARHLQQNLGYTAMASQSYFENGTTGLVTLFNGTVLHQGSVELNGRHIALYVDAEIRGMPVRIYNLHLQSIRLGDQEYVMDLLAPNAYRDSLFVTGSKKIASKLRSSFKIRSAEAKLIRQHLDECETAVILCGDFNDTPASYVYRRILRGGLNDAFRKAGRGMGRTYTGRFPSYRIDYIMVSDHFKTKSFNTLKNGLSDHHPVFAWIRIPNENN